MKKLTQNKSSSSNNNKSKANNKNSSNQNNKNTQNNNTKKRSVPPPSSDSHSKNKNNKKQKMSHNNNNNNNNNNHPQQQMMMKQELLESLMALDDIPLPIPVILLNSITTHAGRSSLIQHLIDHCQGLSIAFLLSNDLVNDIVQNHQQQKSSSSSSDENKPCFSKIFALKEDNNKNKSNRLNQLKNIGLKKNCPFDAIVTDVNTLDELTDILEYFDEISSQEQLNPEYSSPIYLDTIVSVANAHFLHQHMMNNKNENFHVRRDDAKLSLACDISSVILLNFSDLLNEEQMDQLVVKLSVINQVEHAHVIDTVKCNVDLFRVIGTRLIDNELNDRFLIESARFNKSQVVLAIENTAWNTTTTATATATTTTTTTSATSTATTTIKDKNQSTTAGASASALLKKHKNIQVFSSLDQLKDVKKKHLTIVDRSQQSNSDGNSLKTMEHFLENLIMEYKTFPSIEIEKIGVNDVGSMVEETLRQLLMMKYYGEYYDNDSDDEEEEEANDNNNKKRRAMSGKNSGKDYDDLEDGEDENDEDDDEEDRQGEEEDEEEEQKLKMDPEFFLKIHSDDLESWVNDVQHLASVYARQFNNKKTVKITIRQQSLASNNKNKKQQKPVVSTIEERFLFASYLGNGCGVRWFRSEEPNVQIELPPYSIGIRAKPSSVVYDLTQESSLAPHGLGIILIIQ